MNDKLLEYMNKSDERVEKNEQDILKLQEQMDKLSAAIENLKKVPQIPVDLLTRDPHERDRK